MGHSEYDPLAKDRRPWNAGRKIGAKRALKPQQVWAIRFMLDQEQRLALSVAGRHLPQAARRRSDRLGGSNNRRGRQHRGQARDRRFAYRPL